MSRTFGPKLHDTLLGPWEVVRQSLVDELSGFRIAFEKWVSAIVDSNNQLNPDAIAGDYNGQGIVYLSNEGPKKKPFWAKIDLVLGVKKRLRFLNFVAATQESVLVGRGEGSGPGDYQPITLGNGLSMTGTVLSTSGGGGGAPTLVPEDTTFTISENLQVFWHLPIDVEGTFDVEGYLIWIDA